MSSKTLKPLSEEHQKLKEMCLHIRQGLAMNVETGRIRAYVDWFRDVYLKPHLKKEEEELFPLLGKNFRVKRALANHRRILRLLSCSCEDLKVLNLLEEELETQIRFEERVLYKEINKLSPWKKAIPIISAGGEEENFSWKDPFWMPFLEAK